MKPSFSRTGVICATTALTALNLIGITPALAIAVQNFQREHRLTVDGIAGLETQVVLDTALADPGSPLLTHSAPHG